MDEKQKEQWKEENLNHFIHVVINDNLDVHPSSFEMIWLCMKKYAEQEIKELKAENERLKGELFEIKSLLSILTRHNP